MSFDSAIFREALLNELRKSAEEGRIYRTSSAWPIGTDAEGRGDPNLISALPFAEALGNTLEVASFVFVLAKVKSIFDNSNSLPANPAEGDTYIALVTANGWIQNYLYRRSGEDWITVPPIEGTLIVWVEDIMTHKYFKVDSWVDFGGGTPTIPNPLYLNNYVRFRAEGRHYYLEIQSEGGQWEEFQHLSF